MDDTKTNDLLLKIYHYRWTLSIVVVIAAVASIIISFLIEPKYKASVIVFPAPSTTLSKSLIPMENFAKNSVFGEDEEVEQILQVLNSDEIMERIVAQFDLMNHYEIDPEGAYPYTKLMD